MTYPQQIIELLKRHHFGRTNFLTAATGGSYQARRKQIGKMPELRRHNPNGNGDRASQYPRYFHRIYSLAAISRKFNWHQLFIDDILLSIEAACREQGLPFRYIAPSKLPATISWQFTDHYETFDKDVEPDALFAIGDDYFALEADRGTETLLPNTFKDKKSMLRSLLQYQHILANKIYKAWGFPHLKVLFVFDAKGRTPNVMHLMEHTIKMKSRSILFTEIPEFNSDLTVAPNPALDLLERPLLRVGYEPFYLKPKDVSDGRTIDQNTRPHHLQGAD